LAGAEIKEHHRIRKKKTNMGRKQLTLSPSPQGLGNVDGGFLKGIRLVKDHETGARKKKITENIYCP